MRSARTSIMEVLRPLVQSFRSARQIHTTSTENTIDGQEPTNVEGETEDEDEDEDEEDSESEHSTETTQRASGTLPVRVQSLVRLQSLVRVASDLALEVSELELDERMSEPDESNAQRANLVPRGRRRNRPSRAITVGRPISWPILPADVIAVGSPASGASNPRVQQVRSNGVSILPSSIVADSITMETSLAACRRAYEEGYRHGFEDGGCIEQASQRPWNVQDVLNQHL